MAFPLSIAFPFGRIEQGEEFVSMAAVHECARAAEDAGFWSGTVTDHPLPSQRWLGNGGHHAQDPFVMLSLVAAVTCRLRVQTNILVLPYRNPFLTARAVSSLDAFSHGRVVLGLGAGYLKPEFKALAADFDVRNDLMDEYVRAMKLAWSGEEFTFQGTGYAATGNRMLPVPAQQPHPPLLIGGNSKRALRRAVELGDAWHPFFVPEAITERVRTANMSGDADILAAIAYMTEHCRKVGRAELPQIIGSGTFTITPRFSAQEAIDHYARLKALGLAGSGADIEAGSRGEWCNLAHQFGEEVIAKLNF